MNEAFLIKDLSYKNYIVQTDKKKQNGTFSFGKCAILIQTLFQEVTIE